MKSLGILALVLSAWVGSALAEVPTPRDVATAEALLGYDKIVAAAIERGKAHPDPRLAGLPAESRACIQKVISDAFARKVAGDFAALFESSENISAWVEFSRGATGGKFVGFLQGVAAAIAAGQAPPPREQFDAGLTEAEKDELKAFLETPAGSVLSKGFPSLPRGLSEAEARQVDQLALANCGLHLDGKP